MLDSVDESRLVNSLPPSPPNFVRADSKRVTPPFFVSADSAGVSESWVAGRARAAERNDQGLGATYTGELST